MAQKIYVIGGLLLAVVLSAPMAIAQPADLPNIGLAQSAGGGYAPNSVIVRFKANVKASDKARARGLVNAQAHRSFRSVPGLEALRLSGRDTVNNAVSRLSRLPFVAYAEPDYIVQKTTNDTYYSYVYAIENTGQSVNGVTGTADADMDVLEAWTVQAGDPNLVIAVIDEGVQYDHPDLAANMWTNTGEIPGNGIDDDGNGFIDDVYGYDFYDFDGDPMDEGGHGTHVAGTICAEGNNGIGIVGVVQQCKIMALRFLGPQGGYTSGGIAAVDYAVQMGAKISNNSWGGGGFSQGLYDAIAAARDADHVFLAAAGNDGTNNDVSPHYPSNYSLANVVSVAATDNRDRLASFSNYGAQSVDIAAPGVDIASTSIGGTYVWMSGTSMATPNVTGVVALIRSQFPQMGYQEVIDLLYATARPAAAVAGITTTEGIANAEAALGGGQPPTPPLAPTGLLASAESDSAIVLSWVDNSDNEQSFVIERDGQVVTSSIATNSTSYTDRGLSGETTYRYRVRARNSGGDSDWSNEASAVTDAPSPYQTILVSAELTAAGTVTSGDYRATQARDGVFEVIREQESGGRPNRRYSYLQHEWTFTAPSGSGPATLTVVGLSNNSSDGDRFEIAYRTNTASSWTSMCELAVGSPSVCTGSLPVPTSCSVAGACIPVDIFVRVTDTDQSRGARGLDSVSIDYLELVVQSDAGPVTVPSAPSGLVADASVPGEVSLAWTDNADNETRYDIERAEIGRSWSTVDTVGANIESYTDTTVASLVTYAYRVAAGNSAGEAASTSIEVTTAEQVTPDIVLQASGYKRKGWQNVDASWDAGGAAVTLYRNSTDVYSGSGSAFSDNDISKGGAVYDYQVCPSGDARGSETCSNIVTIVF